MSASARSPLDDDEPGIDDYDEMANQLDLLLEQCLEKVESGRVYDATNEKVRIKWIRVAKDVIDVRRRVVNDRELSELAERVERLEDRQEGR